MDPLVGDALARPHFGRDLELCRGALGRVHRGAFLVFFELVKEIGSTRSVVVTYVNTAIAVVLGIVGLGEPLTIGIAIGFPLVIIGSVFATRSRPASTSQIRIGRRRGLDH